MNGQTRLTISQRRCLAARREAIYRAERAAFERRHSAPPPPPLTRRQLIMIAVAWCVVMGTTLWLCTDAGMRFLAAIWGQS